MILPKHKKLVTLGCSFTEGYGLANPKEESWSKILANSLNLECINLGKGGISNDHINNTLVEYIFNNDTDDCFFIVAYTELARFTFGDILHSEKLVHLTPNSRLYPNLAKKIYSEFYNEEYGFKKFLIETLKMQTWLDQQGINYMMVNAIIRWNKLTEYRDKFQNYIEKINLKDFENIYFNAIIEDKLLPDGHPNQEGHQKIAQALYNYITNER